MAPPAPASSSQLPARGPAVTGVGSLPIGDALEAVRFVAAHAPQVPFWPQMPVRGPAEGMLRQALGVPSGLLLDAGAGVLRLAPGARAALLDALVDADPAMTPDQAAGFEPFLRAAGDGDLAHAWAVKGQLAGPVVLARCLATDGGTALDDAELLAAVVGRLAARARWQCLTLLELGLPVVLVVDDPLAGPGTREGDGECPLTTVLAAIADAGAVAGLHTCATPGELPDVDALGLASLDVREGRLPLVAQGLWSGGGWLAAGLVPTVADAAGLPAPEALAARWRSLATATGDPVELAGRTLLTATCGLAGVGPVGASASFTRASEAAALIEGSTG